ncbi:homocysteine S-methyltransferase 2-like [Zingiber officinale]|uniref:homocysteine S-methyltransferase 2-like n=1 Tax=Zingiber officinale TaxID=94328 RepID=UPI001C4B8326|nr:homocysteine S-methyltransferase 2-like [Zingiber officinale]
MGSFDTGKRYVRPYYFEFISHVKNRWAGKTIVDLFAEEFKGALMTIIEGAINLKQRPVLVAASIGSYGAYLADGSEYSGNYGQEITVEIVKDFHRRRLGVLSEAGANIIAFETIPNKLEAQAYIELLLECDTKISSWFSFTSKDGINVVSGDSMAECVSLADSCNKVVAIGINCTAPRFIHNLILSIKKLNAQFRRNPSLIQNLTTY